MKHFLLAWGSCLLLAGSAQAQLSLRAGGNLLRLAPTQQQDGSASLDVSRRGGYQLGLAYQVPLTKHFALVPEVQFSRERQHATFQNYESIDASLSSEYQLGLSYLNLPVLLRLHLGPVYIETGPQLSWLVGGHAEGTSTYVSIAGPYSVPIDQAATDQYKRLDVGSCLGIGIQLPSGLGLNLYAYQSLVPLDRATYTSQYQQYQQGKIPTLNKDEYRQTLQASLSYQVPARH